MRSLSHSFEGIPGRAHRTFAVCGWLPRLCGLRECQISLLKYIGRSKSCHEFCGAGGVERRAGSAPLLPDSGRGSMASTMFIPLDHDSPHDACRGRSRRISSRAHSPRPPGARRPALPATRKLAQSARREQEHRGSGLRGAQGPPTRHRAAGQGGGREEAHPRRSRAAPAVPRAQGARSPTGARVAEPGGGRRRGFATWPASDRGCPTCRRGN